MDGSTAINSGAATNGADGLIDLSQPWRVEIELTGTADMLFHRWDNVAVATKSKAAKNSAAKKTDNIESYVWKDANGFLCLPGEYVRQSIITAAKFSADPRSPRKSAMDLFKAGVVSFTTLASLGKKAWDYEDRRRVVVQRSAVTRVRPAFLAGWQATVILGVLVPEYISPALLQEVAERAGRLVGVADFRPSFGRYSITRFEVLGDE